MYVIIYMNYVCLFLHVRENNKLKRYLPMIYVDRNKIISYCCQLM